MLETDQMLVALAEHSLFSAVKEEMPAIRLTKEEPAALSCSRAGKALLPADPVRRQPRVER